MLHFDHMFYVSLKSCQMTLETLSLLSNEIFLIMTHIFLQIDLLLVWPRILQEFQPSLQSTSWNMLIIIFQLGHIQALNMAKS